MTPPDHRREVLPVMLGLLAMHFVAAAAAPALARRFGRRVFVLLASVPLVAFVWVLLQTGTVRDGGTLSQTVSWIPSLGLDLDFRLGTLQWVLALIVTGIGTLVLIYCEEYFHDSDRPVGPFAGVFVAFAGAMLGLVLSDNLLLLYVFWEATTVFSYLLIGTDPTKRAARMAALQALLVTTLGGLAMLVGMLMLGQRSGTYRISGILTDPPETSTGLVVATMLLLLGAVTKSALVPFHFWLPAAMAAPTPVSAYLHAASMVKAGVYLVALLAPAFAGVPGWRGLLLALGLMTMLVGGWRALLQFDIKLLLAYGTVSQLGFLLVVLSAGTRSAALAGLAVLVAHALFKATLFLVVGIIDHNAGSRDLRKLSGIGRRSRGLLVVAVVAGASMAGVPPLLGFVGKESVLGAFADIARAGDGTGLAGLPGWGVLAGIVAGSILTTAYTLRFLWGAFARKKNVPDIPFTPVTAGFLAPAVVLTLFTLTLGFCGAWLTGALGPYTRTFPAGAHAPELTVWHGVGLPLALSVVALGGGVALFVLRRGFTQVQLVFSTRWSAEKTYLWAMRSVDRLAVEITGMTQRGSVATYLSVILLVVLAVPGYALVRTLSQNDPNVRLWDSPAQAVVGVVIVAAALFTARARRRLRAVLLVGVAGYGTAMLFVLHGAPDLALTQVLVETTSLVAFVLVLRRLPAYFTDRPLSAKRYLRVLLGIGVGAAVAGFLLISSNARTHSPVSAGFPEEAVEFGGGTNIVSVTLVDIRAWDTMGEISVLVAAATGVASLIFLDTRRSGIRRVADLPYPHETAQHATAPSPRAWLPGSRTLSPELRSIIFEVVTRFVFHSMVIFGIYLLFAGHNFTGGGFAGGIVTGLALVVRYLAGGRYELDEAAPVDAGGLMGTGLFLSAAAGVLPLAFGGAVLQSYQVDLHLPLLGDHHLVSSLFFDIGVYLVVVGLLLDLLRTFGSRIDRDILREKRADAAGRESSAAS